MTRTVARPTVHDVVSAYRTIRPHVRRTPLVDVTLPGEDGHRVALKLESLQPTHSFKVRGAVNAALRLRNASSASAPRELVTASAGNHGQALAYAARLAQLPLVVFTPTDAPQAKLAKIRELGATLRAEAHGYDETEPLALAYAERTGAMYVSPYNDADVIAGAGTVALEVLDQRPDLDTIVLPAGGGGLISGIAIAMKALAPRVRVVGVEPAHNPAFTSALAAGRIVTIDPRPTIADGLSGNMEPGSVTFNSVRELVDEIVQVTEDDLDSALARLFEREHLVAEGAGAAAFAAVLAGRVPGERIVAVLSGANIDTDRLVGALARARSAAG
ncbi:MAG: threonine/serine dehydratase [Vicinamibacterales bacterium]